MITPSWIVFSKASLPIATLASSIALALSVILVFLLISASASFSSCSKAALRASKLSFSSFLSSSTLVLAFSASSLALANSASASALALSASSFLV